MVNVILYTRVSTDEQTDGMSLEAQERYLRAYCSNHDYNIVGDEQPYKEDHSAKSHELDRPELMKVYKYCKKHRGQVNKVLFLRLVVIVFNVLRSCSRGGQQDSRKDKGRKPRTPDERGMGQ